MAVRKTRMLVLEINEAEKHFLDKYVALGQLPVFEKLLKGGRFFKTEVPTEAALNSWAVWSSIYTGMPFSKHGMIGFGQIKAPLSKVYLWDQFNSQGITTGVFGSMVNALLPEDPNNLFFIPGEFTNSQLSFPHQLESIQDFFRLTEKPHLKQRLGLCIKLLWRLAIDILKGLPLIIARLLFKQIFLEFKNTKLYQRTRFVLRAQLKMSIFQSLYEAYNPAFAMLHLEHIAYAQRHYWRAAEPENFQDKLGEFDEHFFGSLEARKTHEFALKDSILESFKAVDVFLEGLLPKLDDNTLLVIITGLGQKKRDPSNEIHKPKMHFRHIKKLLSLADVGDCEILSQMDPSLTLNFLDSTEASLGAYRLSSLKVLGQYPLFKIEQRENQVFLEGLLPPNIWFMGKDAWVENEINERVFLLFDYIEMSPLKDQETSEYSREGWMLCFGDLSSLPVHTETLDILGIYPLLLTHFYGTK